MIDKHLYNKIFSIVSEYISFENDRITVSKFLTNQKYFKEDWCTDDVEFHLLHIVPNISIIDARKLISIVQGIGNEI